MFKQYHSPGLQSGVVRYQSGVADINPGLCDFNPGLCDINPGLSVFIRVCRYQSGVADTIRVELGGRFGVSEPVGSGCVVGLDGFQPAIEFVVDPVERGVALVRAW